MGTTFHCSAQASHYSGFSCSGAQALGIQASVVGARGLKSAGSVVVEHRLSCCMSYGIFSDQGLNPCLLHWQEILIHWSTREVPLFYFSIYSLWAILLLMKNHTSSNVPSWEQFFENSIFSSPQIQTSSLKGRKDGKLFFFFFLGYNHPQVCGTMVRCSECKVSQSAFTTGWSWTSQSVFLSLSFLIYEVNLKVVPSLQGWCWEDCRGPAPADPGYSKRGRRRRPI